MAETIKIGGELESMATGKVVAAASAIKDKARGKTQDRINTDVEEALASHTSRIDDTNAKVAINEQEIDSVRDIIRTHEFEQGVVQYADDVYCDVEGLVTANVQAALGELAKEVFPLVATIDLASASNTGGNYEVGSHAIARFVLDCSRRGNDVLSSSTILLERKVGSGSYEEREYNIANSVIGDDEGSVTNNCTYRITITQNGQSVVIDDTLDNGKYKGKLSFTFMNYRYRGAVSANNIPPDATAKTNYVKQLCQNNTISKELSTSTQLTGKNALAADKCYVFVIPTQSPNLIVKNANSGGTVDNAGSGTFELARVNGTGTVNCKYVIVPASPNAWNFEITN